MIDKRIENGETIYSATCYYCGNVLEGICDSELEFVEQYLDKQEWREKSIEKLNPLTNKIEITTIIICEDCNNKTE